MSQRPQSDGPADPVEEAARLLASAARPTKPLVLLDGPPLSGVTRTMWEAVQRFDPQTQLAPFRAGALAEFCTRADAEAQLTPPHGAVLWLDDLAPADLVLLGHGLLDQVLPHAVVLAAVNTIWADRVLADGSAVTAPARTVLREYAQRVTVPFVMTPRERNWLRAQGYPVSKGIAESLVGGENLVQRYRRAARSEPAGHLLVQVAVDARRCGIHRPLTTEELYRLWSARSGSPDESRLRFQHALDWASAVPQGASTGLLFRAEGGRSQEWRVLAYAAGSDDGDHGHKPRPLDDRAWEDVAELLPDAGDQYALGVAAQLQGRTKSARAAFTRAVRAAAPGHPVGAAAHAALGALGEAT